MRHPPPIINIYEYQLLRRDATPVERDSRKYYNDTLRCRIHKICSNFTLPPPRANFRPENSSPKQLTHASQLLNYLMEKTHINNKNNQP